MNVEEGGCCTCIPAATRKQISGLMDFSLMKDPVFLFIGVSNIFGMLGFYVPYVYIIDAASTKVTAGFGWLGSRQVDPYRPSSSTALLSRSIF